MKGKQDFLYEKFPEGFLWGAGTSAFQVEGAWDQEGRSETVWDRFSHQPGHVINNTNADVTCDSYHRLVEDVNVLAEMGAQCYRFSLSWARLFPDGDTKKPNPRGLMYYNRLLNSLRNHSIEPIVAMYHHDLPQWLLAQGGWDSKDCVKHFTDYATACFENFGDRVKLWLTMNDPWTEAVCGYERGITAPGRKYSGDSVYRIVHNMLRAHGSAYRTYKSKFYAKQKGSVSIALNVDWLEPKNPDDPEHVEAANRAMEFKWGWTAQPIFGDGEYPEAMRKTLGDRMPKFTPGDKKNIKGSADFFALNHFTSMLSVPDTHKAAKPGYLADKKVEHTFKAEWNKTASPMMRVSPDGFRKSLNWIKDKYNNPTVYVTANGVSDQGTSMDIHRIGFIRDYIQEMLKAIKLDGCKVASYSYWSLMDSFEFSLGYSAKFGLFHVDFKDNTRPRRPKDSARYYAKIIHNNGFEREQGEK